MDVRVSFAQFDPAATLCDVRVAWCQFDPNAATCDVRVAWCQFDPLAQRAANDAVSGWGGILGRFKQRRQTPEELEAERIKLGILPPRQITEERAAVSRKLQSALDAAQRSKAAADQSLLWELHAYEALLAAEYQQLLEQAIAQEKARRQEEEDVAVVLSMLAAMA